MADVTYQFIFRSEQRENHMKNRINSRVMKENNVLLIMDIIMRMGPISRSDLAQMVGLTQVSVINITNELLDAGILEQVGVTNGSNQGRRAIVLDVKRNCFYALCLVLRVEEMVCGIADLRGNVLDTIAIDYPARLTADELVCKVERLVEELVQRKEISRDKILGIGIAAPGPLDVQSGTLVNPPNFPHLQNFPFRDKLQERLKLPVCLDKETNLAALAEYYYGMAKNYRTSFFISVFHLGIGGGLISGGELFHGFRDGAGEIGHMTVEPSGRKCGCGNYGCLETMISEENVITEAKNMLKMGIGDIYVKDIDRITLADIFEKRQLPGVNVFALVLDKMVSYLSLALGNIINLYSPELITIGGSIPEIDSAFVDLVAEKVHARSFPSHCKDVVIKKTEFGPDVFMKGASALVMKKFLVNILPQNL